MPKTTTKYVCSECGSSQMKWMGKCPSCGGWNTLVEEKEGPAPEAGGGRHWQAAEAGPQPKPVALNKLSSEAFARLSTGLSEVDRVLGGGLVPGSLVLIGGEPGIGKSTLVLQACAGLEKSGLKVLYASGEESAQQIQLRARRLGLEHSNIELLCEASWERVAEAAVESKAGVLVIDSIQTLFTSGLPASAGSVAQARECAMRIMGLAKNTGLPVLLVGHVTKEGTLAGPKVLEHLVDTVLQFEGDAHQGVRALRSVKNRFGNTEELGLFEMGEHGLSQVTNPSAYLLRQRGLAQPGSTAMACLEGSQPLLVEVQALVTPTHYGTPQRSSSGLDPYRLNLIYAVLEKRAGILLYNHDVFVSVAGGFELREPASDLAIACSVASSHRDKPLPDRWIVFGEVGLAGELRPVLRTELRLKEAARMGFKDALIPYVEGKEKESLAKAGVNLHMAKEIREAINLVLG